MKKLLLIFLVTAASAQMRVHLINVGQGCATLVEFPCAAVLVDTGGENDSLFDSKAALKQYLDDFFERRTDLNHTLQCVYLTHPHKDHTLGVPVILEPPFVIKNVVTDGLERGSGKPGQLKLHRAVQTADATPTHADDIGFDAVTTDKIGPDGLTNSVIDAVNCAGTDPMIKILWGTSTTNPGWSKDEFRNANNHSLVIKMQYGTSSLLITGDLEDTALHNLIAKYNTNATLDADVYIVGHHGSKNGTTKELLDKITPQIALIGVGEMDWEHSWTAWAFGHPNKGVLDLLQSSLTATRAPIDIQAGTGAKNFVDYTVTKAIYATAWDDNVVLEADAAGHWKKLDTDVVPALVNINTATMSEMQALPGIGETKAQAIVDYRTAHGNFTTIENLVKVHGIGPATLNLIRAYIKI